MLAIAYRVVGLCRRYKIGGDDAGALVDELIESVLTVGAWLAPNNRASIVIHLKNEFFFT